MNTSSRVGRWSVIIGIMIVLNLFFSYALSLVYKSPDFQTYCPDTQVISSPTTEEACVSSGGQWTASDVRYIKVPAPGEANPGYCDVQYTCRQQFQSATDTYSRNVFVTLVVLGAIVIAIGSFLVSNAVIASGLALAGVLSFIIASFRYWGAASDLIRLIILAIALALLFWVAVKKFKNQ